MTQKKGPLNDSLNDSSSNEYSTLETPIGTLHIVATQKGVAQISFSVPAAYKKRFTRSAQDVGKAADSPIMKKVKKQLGEYFQGKRRTWDVPLDWSDQNGFYKNARKACAKVGYGKTVSYKELAGRAGEPKAARAAGTAMATNPISIIVPCHRVVKSDGEPGKYGGGDATKKWLLQFESQAL